MYFLFPFLPLRIPQSPAQPSCPPPNVDTPLSVPQADGAIFFSLSPKRRILNIFIYRNLIETTTSKQKTWVLFSLLSENIMETMSRGHGNHLMKNMLNLQMREKMSCLEVLNHCPKVTQIQVARLDLLLRSDPRVRTLRTYHGAK